MRTCYQALVLLVFLGLANAQNTYATVDWTNTTGLHFDGYVERILPVPTPEVEPQESPFIGGAVEANPVNPANILNLDERDGQTDGNPYEDDEDEDSCDGMFGVRNENVQLKANPFGIDLNLAAKNGVRNFQIVGILLGAYNPWSEDDGMMDEMHGDGWPPLMGAYVHRTTQKVYFSIPSGMDVGLFDVKPVLLKWFMPVDSSNQPLWNRFNEPLRPFGQVPLKPDGNGYWQEATPPDFTFVGSVEYEAFTSWKKSDGTYGKLRLVAVNKRTLQVELNATLTDPMIAFMPFSPKYYVPYDPTTLLPLWDDATAPTTDWDYFNPPQKPDNSGPYWTAAARPILRFDYDSFQEYAMSWDEVGYYDELKQNELTSFHKLVMKFLKKMGMEDVLEEMDMEDEEEDKPMNPFDSPRFYVYINAADKKVMFTPPANADVLALGTYYIRPFVPRFYTARQTAPGSADLWNLGNAPQQQWDFWNPPKDASNVSYWTITTTQNDTKATSGLPVDFYWLGEDVYQSLHMIPDQGLQRMLTLVPVDVFTRQISWTADLKSFNIQVVPFSSTWFDAYTTATPSVKINIAANVFWDWKNPPTVNSVLAWTGATTSTYPNFQIRPEVVMTAMHRIMMLRMEELENEPFGPAKWHVYVDSNNLVVTDLTTLNQATNNVIVVPFNPNWFLPLNPANSDTPYWLEGSAPTDATTGLKFFWDPWTPPIGGNYWDPTTTTIKLKMTVAGRTLFNQVTTKGGQQQFFVPINKYMNRLVFGAALTGYEIEVIKWDPSLFVPLTSQGADIWTTAPTTYWNWYTPPTAAPTFTASATQQFKYLGELEDDRFDYVYVDANDNVVFDLQSAPANLALEIVPFIPERFAALDALNANLFTDLGSWNFNHPPINPTTGLPYFTPGPTIKFKWLGRTQHNAEWAVPNVANEVRKFIAINVQDRTIVERADLYNYDMIYVVPWMPDCMVPYNRDSVTQKLTPYFTSSTKPAAGTYWTRQSPPPSTWAGATPSTYPKVFQYVGNLPGDYDKFEFPYVNYYGLLVEASTNYVLWAQKTPPVNVYVIPFRPEWFVALKADNTNAFDPLTVGHWNFSHPAKNSLNVSLWDPKDQSTWPIFKFVGKEWYEMEMFDITEIFFDLDPTAFTYSWSVAGAYNVSEYQQQFPCDIDVRLYATVKSVLTAAEYPFVDGWGCQNVKDFIDEMRQSGIQVNVSTDTAKIKQFVEQRGQRLDDLLSIAVEFDRIDPSINIDLTMEGSGQFRPQFNQNLSNTTDFVIPTNLRRSIALAAENYTMADAIAEMQAAVSKITGNTTFTLNTSETNLTKAMEPAGIELQAWVNSQMQAGGSLDTLGPILASFMELGEKIKATFGDMMNGEGGMNGMEDDGMNFTATLPPVLVTALKDLPNLDVSDPNVLKHVMRLVKEVLMRNMFLRHMFEDAWIWMFSQDLTLIYNQRMLAQLIREFVGEILRVHRPMDITDYMFVQPSILDMVASHMDDSMVLDAATIGLFTGVTTNAQQVTIPAANIKAGVFYVVQVTIKRAGADFATAYYPIEGLPAEKPFVNFLTNSAITVEVLNNGTFTAVAPEQPFLPLQSYRVSWTLTAAEWASLGATPKARVYYGIYEQDGPEMIDITQQTGNFNFTLPQLDGVNVALLGIRAETASDIKLFLIGKKIVGRPCNKIQERIDILSQIDTSQPLSAAQTQAILESKIQEQQLGGVQRVFAKPADLPKGGASLCFNDCTSSTAGTCKTIGRYSSCDCNTDFYGTHCSMNKAQFDVVNKALVDKIDEIVVNSPADRSNLFKVAGPVFLLGANSKELNLKIKTKLVAEINNIDNVNDCVSAFSAFVQLGKAQISVEKPADAAALLTLQKEQLTNLNQLLTVAVKLAFALSQNFQVTESGFSSRVYFAINVNAVAQAPAARRVLQGTQYKTFDSEGIDTINPCSVQVKADHPLFVQNKAKGMAVNLYEEENTNGIPEAEDIISYFYQIQFTDDQGAAVDFNDEANPITVTIYTTRSPASGAKRTIVYFVSSSDQTLLKNGITITSDTSANSVTFTTSHNGWFAVMQEIPQVTDQTTTDNNSYGSIVSSAILLVLLAFISW